jgi:hypothetical protein
LILTLIFQGHQAGASSKDCDHHVFATYCL